MLGFGYGDFFIIYTEPLALLLSLSVTEESIMPMTHEGAPFPLPKEECWGQIT